MRIVMFYHSLVSDWNHGNAHFLRGIATELISRGHEVRVYEPRDGWSARNLAASEGEEALEGYRKRYPLLPSCFYEPASLDLDEELDGAEVVLVHEWNSRDLVKRIGEHRRRSGGYVLLFHDTHHRAVSNPGEMAGYELSQYDGIVAFGESLRVRYQETHPQVPVHVWHEAADTRVFRPVSMPGRGDLVWIGNWGDEERTAELREYLLEPAKGLRLRGEAYGVRYPAEAIDAFGKCGMRYGGWLPNYRVPEVFAGHLVTVHVPRRPYAEMLPGIPTIRVFEALACGIPLVCAPWEDREELFRPGEDFLVARTGEEMRRHLRALLSDADYRRAVAASGLRRVQQRHTCGHRVDELMRIVSAC